MDARRTPLKEKDALELIRHVDDIYATRGQRVIHVDLRNTKPDKTELLGLLLGPTGNLRAPTLRRGRTLIVGFDLSTYSERLR